MDIVTLWKNEQFYSELVFFNCYLEVHQKILNSIHEILQNCKHLPKSKILQGHSKIIAFNGLLEIVYLFLDHLDGIDYINTLQLIKQLCFLLVSCVVCVTCNCDHFIGPLTLCGFIPFFVYFLVSMPCVQFMPFGDYYSYTCFICLINHNICLNSHNIMYMILIIIYCFDLKILLSVCFNIHYIFVQNCSSLAIFLFLFCINKYFLM